MPHTGKDKSYPSMPGHPNPRMPKVYKMPKTPKNKETGAKQKVNPFRRNPKKGDK